MRVSYLSYLQPNNDFEYEAMVKDQPNTTIHESEFQKALLKQFPTLANELAEHPVSLQFELSALLNYTERCIDSGNRRELQRIFDFVFEIIKGNKLFSEEVIKATYKYYIDCLIFPATHLGDTAERLLPREFHGIWGARRFVKDESSIFLNLNLSPNSAIENKAWREYAEEMGGQLIEKRKLLGIFGTDQMLVVPIDSWLLTLEYLTGFDADIDGGGDSWEITRMVVPFRSNNYFSFSKKYLSFEIHTVGILSLIAKSFSSQYLKSGDPEFDKVFVAKGTNHDFLQNLLSNKDFRRTALKWLESGIFYHSNELVFEYDGEINSSELLKGVHFLFSITLNLLLRWGYDDTNINEKRNRSIRRKI